MKIVVSQNLDEIYRTYSSVLYKISLRYASCEAEAEDILHDSFIRIYERLPQYKGEGSLEGWLKRVVVSVALNRLRTNRFTPKYHEDFDDINESDIQNTDDNQSDENKEKILNAGLTHDDVLTCMHQLPAKARTVFNLYVFEEKKHKEIAKELGITASTSKTQLKRARVLLNDLLLKHSEMKVKDLKKLSVLAIFFPKDNYHFIDGFVKESVNNAIIDAPPMDMTSVIEASKNISGNGSAVVNTPKSGNVFTQIGNHITGNIFTYAISSVIATAVTIGTINIINNTTSEYKHIPFIEPRNIHLDVLEMEENDIIDQVDSFAPVKADFKEKPIIQHSQKAVPDTVTQYERVRVIDTLN